MSLRRTVPVLLVLLAIGVGVVKSQPQVDQRNFWALNNTQKEIREFYVSAHNDTRWENDVLGRATLPNLMGTVIVFTPAVKTGCVFDFKLVYADGSAQQYLQGRDVCQIFGIQFNATDSFALVRQ